MAADRDKLDGLHALLVAQCSEIDGVRYPYALGRAHEEAVERTAHRELVDDLIRSRLWERGQPAGGPSSKQLYKDLSSLGGIEMIPIGRLIRSSLLEFVVGCGVSQLSAAAFGALVYTLLGEDLAVYGVIADICIQDDNLVRQIARAGQVSQALIADNHPNRLFPVEIRV